MPRADDSEADNFTTAISGRLVFYTLRFNYMARNNSNNNGNAAGALGFEATLWSAAEKLKGNMDAGEYKHVVLGLIFLKYISDAFEERHATRRSISDFSILKSGMP